MMTTEELKQLCDTYPWFGAAWCELHRAGESVPEARLLAMRMRLKQAALRSQLKSISADELAPSLTVSIINEFIRQGEHKIVVSPEMDDSSMAFAAPVEADCDDDEAEFVSEELAEIYASQRLFDQAIEIYQKLSLQNSQKSIYFAELIAHLEERKQQENNK